MPTCFLLAATAPPPAADVAAALALHVWSRWCPRAHYTLNAFWDSAVPARKKQLTQRSDPEPLADCFQRAVDAGADRVVVGQMSVSLRMPWLTELRRAAATQNLEHVEVRWQRGGLRAGTAAWCGVVLIHTGTKPSAAALDPAIGWPERAAPAIAELQAAIPGIEFDAQVYFEERQQTTSWLLR